MMQCEYQPCGNHGEYGESAFHDTVAIFMNGEHWFERI